MINTRTIIKFAINVYEIFLIITLQNNLTAKISIVVKLFGMYFKCS